MKPASILITDDESNIRMMLRMSLESDGYSVREASNGKEALESIKQNAPDLMVLDLNMPVIDGMAVLEQMKSMVGVRPRVIILTAYGSIPAAVKATRLGVLDFLEKPITPAELRQTVRSVLHEPELDVPQDYVEESPNEYDLALDRIRKSLRLADYSNAEQMLMVAAEQNDQQSAQYFNLLGVLYEAQRKWRLAKKCYGKAITADKNYEPAQLNLRRLYELHTFGKSQQGVVLGDEAKDVMYAKLP